MPVNIFGLICLVTMTLYVVPAMTSSFGQNKDGSKDADLLKIVAQVNQFGRQFLNHMSKSYKHREKDIIFSSPSIFLLLSLLYEDSLGETRREIEQALFPGSPHSTVAKDIKKMLLRIKQLSRAKNVTLTTNTLAIFNTTKNNVTGKFVQKAEESFEAKIYSSTDMDVLKSNIKNFNQDLMQSSTLPKQQAEFFKIETPAADIGGLLHTYVYFKASWDKLFESTDTSDAEFLVEDTDACRKCVMVPTMKQVRRNYWYSVDETVSILSIPFSDDHLVFYVVMPTSRTTDLRGVHKFLRECIWKNVSEKMHTHGKGVNVHLPKFEIEANYNLREGLKQLGIFIELAQFPSIGNVTVSKATHKAFLKIDESGGKAGAKSELRLLESSLRKPQEFKVDRPFGFAIVDNSTGLALLQGVFRGQQFKERRRTCENFKENYVDY